MGAISQIMMSISNRYEDTRVGVGEAIFTTTGSFSFVVPNEITSLCAVAVGGGGGGGGNAGVSGPGSAAGGGGGLSYRNNIPVTPGETLSIVVGTGGTRGGTTTQPTAGGYTRLRRGTTTLLLATGGGQGTTNSSTAIGGAGGVPSVGTGGSGGKGGDGKNNSSGAGGGGAGGYSGNGGTEDQNGAGGGGAGGKDINSMPPGPDSGGGGVGVYGQGNNGLAGSASTVNGSNTGTTIPTSTTGGLYGGGGGSTEDDTVSEGLYGGKGALRILWGSGRSFPSTDVSTDYNKINGNYINFWYHQYGANQGTLYLERWTGSSWDSIWSSSGDQENVWKNVITPWFANSSKIRFRNVAVGGYRGDIALDYIRIYKNNSLMDSESFETSLGGWVNDPSNTSNWIRRSGSTTSSSTGPTAAYSGSYYIYVETSSGSSYTNGDTDIIEHSY